MSDSIDRVFVKAITTIKALSSRSNHGSLPRPPAENRIKLYGLYKQATEGNVQGIMPRPEGFTVEDEGARKKWDAWKREEGLSKTQAKRSYISCLIETMRVYATDTSEARELLGELEYLWDQIKNIECRNDDDEDEDAYPYARQAYPYNIAQSVASQYDHDQSDRFSAGTPWPLRSNYSASVSTQQHKSNIDQIYSHARRTTQLSLSEPKHPRRLSGPLPAAAAAAAVPKFASRIPVYGDAAASVSTPNLDDFRAWQGQVNSIINKLSREFAFRRGTAQGANALAPNENGNENESENEADPHAIMRRKLVFLLRHVGRHAFHLAKNFAISVLAILFVIWCVNKSVLVRRTVVKTQLQGRPSKELVINMVINTDENKWFIRLLSLVNKFVGFV